MYSIIYRSIADPDFSTIDIYQMLSKARDNNQENGVTGCLLYHQQQFVQLLEGEKNVITSLYEKILNDSRHKNIATIKEKQIDRPIFLDWSMAFHDFQQNGISKHQKLKKIDQIFEQSSAFDKGSDMALNFFKNVNDILFTKN